MEEGGPPGLAKVLVGLAEASVGGGAGHGQVEGEEEDEGQGGRCHVVAVLQEKRNVPFAKLMQTRKVSFV